MAQVHWLALQPVAKLNDLLNAADIHLLPQRADAADLVMPSKLAFMLASGRPVVAGAAPGTALARAIEGAASPSPPGDAGGHGGGGRALAQDDRRGVRRWAKRRGPARWRNGIGRRSSAPSRASSARPSERPNPAADR